MKVKQCICVLAIATLLTGCGNAQRKVNKSEVEVNKERLWLIEDYNKCIKKADEDEVKVKACEPTLKAAEALK